MSSERKGTLVARLSEDLQANAQAIAAAPAPAQSPAPVTPVNPLAAAPTITTTTAAAMPVLAYPQMPAVPAATPREFALAVEDMRDACLRLSREAMDDRTTVAELARQMQIIQTHLNFLASTQGYTISLGAGSGR